MDESVMDETALSETVPHQSVLDETELDQTVLDQRMLDRPAVDGPTTPTDLAESMLASFPDAVAELDFAHRNVPFYAGHLDGAGIDPARIRNPEQFRAVPPTSKVDYRRHFPAGVLVRGTTMSDAHVFRSRSSGTSGDRLITLAHTFALAERQLRTTSVNPDMTAVFARSRDQRVCRYAPPACSDVECATPATTVASRTLDDGTLVLPVAHDVLATAPALLDQAIGELRDHRPHWIYADPVHLALLVDGMRERGLAPPQTGGVVLAYNLATASALRRIREYLPAGTVVTQVASMSELGWLGMTCPEGSLHLNTDSFYPELLAADSDRPAEPGELAELYVTSIGDRISPHIRYRTGDLYVLQADSCACGHRFPVVEHHGRRTDAVSVGRTALKRTSDGDAEAPDLFTARMLDGLVGPAPWLRFYKLTVRPADAALQLLTEPDVPAVDVEALAADLAARISDRIGRRVTATPVSHIDAERSGKLFALAGTEAAT